MVFSLGLVSKYVDILIFCRLRSHVLGIAWTPFPTFIKRLGDPQRLARANAKAATYLLRASALPAMATTKKMVAIPRRSKVQIDRGVAEVKPGRTLFAPWKPSLQPLTYPYAFPKW